MPHKKQDQERKEEKPFSIRDVVKILGWSEDTIRRNLSRFDRYPHGQAISRTPGGHLRFLPAAVYWVQGNCASTSTTADALLSDLY